MNRGDQLIDTGLMPNRIVVGTASVGLLTQREQGVGYVSRDQIAAASLAQLAEQLALNQRVDGSSPSGGISIDKDL